MKRRSWFLLLWYMGTMEREKRSSTLISNMVIQRDCRESFGWEIYHEWDDVLEKERLHDKPAFRANSEYTRVQKYFN